MRLVERRRKYQKGGIRLKKRTVKNYNGSRDYPVTRGRRGRGTGGIFGIFLDDELAKGEEMYRETSEMGGCVVF